MSQGLKPKYPLLVLVLVTAGGAWLLSALWLLQHQAGLLPILFRFALGVVCLISGYVVLGLRRGPVA
jgi:hypothetical protein